MRRKEKEITDKSTLEHILNDAVDCRIALCDDNIPYIVPMNFGYRDNCIYLHGAKEGKKLDIISKNNNVCFEATINSEVIKSESSCSWSMKFSSVIGLGKAVIVEDFNEKKKALDIIMDKYTRLMGGTAGNAFEYPESAVNAVAIIRIDIDSMTGKKSNC